MTSNPTIERTADFGRLLNLDDCRLGSVPAAMRQQALVLLCKLRKSHIVDDSGGGRLFVSSAYRPTDPPRFQIQVPPADLTGVQHHRSRLSRHIPDYYHEHLAIDPIVIELSLSHCIPDP